MTIHLYHYHLFTFVQICHEYVKQQEMALETGVQADCMLECNGQLIPVNRFCLCVHSKVNFLLKKITKIKNKLKI